MDRYRLPLSMTAEHSYVYRCNVLFVIAVPVHVNNVCLIV